MYFTSEIARALIGGFTAIVGVAIMVSGFVLADKQDSDIEPICLLTNLAFGFILILAGLAIALI